MAYFATPIRVLQVNLGMQMKQVNAESYKVMRLFFQELRKSKGFTLKQLAELLGADQSDISKIERGERRLDVVELIYICRVLGIPATEFIENVETRLAEDPYSD